MKQTFMGSEELDRAENLRRARALLAELELRASVSPHASTTAAMHLAQAGHRLAFGCCSSHVRAAVKAA